MPDIENGRQIERNKRASSPFHYAALLVHKDYKWG
jgi:hypothetical protein